MKCLKWLLASLVLGIAMTATAQSEEIASEGRLIPAEILKIDSARVYFLSVPQHQNLSLHLRRVDFVVVPDSTRARDLRQQNRYFAPFVRAQISDRDSSSYETFRQLYESRNSLLRQQYPYQQHDLNYLAGIRLQRAGRLFGAGIVAAALGGLAAVLTNDRNARIAGVGAAIGSGVCLGLGGNGCV
jgi:hypothetical protein